MYTIDLRTYPKIKGDNISGNRRKQSTGSTCKYKGCLTNLKRKTYARNKEMKRMQSSEDDVYIKYSHPIFDVPVTYRYTKIPFAVWTKWHYKYLWSSGITDRLHKLLKKLYSMEPEKRPENPVAYLQHNFSNVRWPDWVFKFAFLWLHCCELEITNYTEKIANLKNFKASLEKQIDELSSYFREMDFSAVNPFQLEERPDYE